MSEFRHHAITRFPMSMIFRLTPTLLATVLVLLPACGMLGGGDQDRLDMTDFYNLYLPLVREVPHPDSSIADDDDRLNEIRMRWSVNHNKRYGSAEFAPGNYTTFATLWNVDLSRASLTREIAGDLSPDLRERMQQEQQERFEGSVVFDVHVFVPATGGYDLSDTNLRGAGSSVELLVGSESYRPTAIESGLVEQYQMGASEVPTFYRLNRLYFDRHVDAADILEGAEQLRLVVRTVRGTSNEIWFTWRIAD